MEAPIIRKLVPEDRQQWSSLWDGYNEFTGGQVRPPSPPK